MEEAFSVASGKGPWYLYLLTRCDSGLIYVFILHTVHLRS